MPQIGDRGVFLAERAARRGTTWTVETVVIRQEPRSSMFKRAKLDSRRVVVSIHRTYRDSPSGVLGPT
jgi:hypothetical protein